MHRINFFMQCSFSFILSFSTRSVSVGLSIVAFKLMILSFLGFICSIRQVINFYAQYSLYFQSNSMTFLVPGIEAVEELLSGKSLKKSVLLIIVHHSEHGLSQAVDSADIQIYQKYPDCSNFCQMSHIMISIVRPWHFYLCLIPVRMLILFFAIYLNGVNFVNQLLFIF